MASRPKMWVCGRSPAEIVGSNNARGMEVGLLYCVLTGRNLSATSCSIVQRSDVIVCDLETESMRCGPQGHRAKKKNRYMFG